MNTKKIEKLVPIHPGEILLEEFLKPMGISINKLSRELLVPPNRISEIVNGKRAITADTALRLGKYFGVSPEIWTGLQMDYEIRKLKQIDWPQIEPRIHAFAA
jgi:addiction module HigA family antidote